MKVVFIGTLPPTIGLSPYCLHLSNSLSKKIDLEFIDFKLFSVKSKSFIGENKIDNKYYQDIINNLKVKRILNYYNPFSGLKAGIGLTGDVLHVQWWISSLVFVYLPILLLAKLKKLKIIISYHNILPHERNKILLVFNRIANLLLFSFVDSFIVHNKRNKKQFMKLYNINGKKISIITHGSLDLVKKNIISKIESKKYLNLPIEKKIILFFGYIRPYKGVDILIKSFYILRKDIENVILMIVGQPINDKWKKYDALIKKYELKENIQIKIGFISEDHIQYYFSASDLVVLPYKYLDTHGGVGALALAFKKPLIVTDVGGLPEFIKDKRALVKPNNAEDLAKTIKLILKDRILYSKLIRDSEKLSKKLNWDKIADQTIELYKKIL